MNQLKQLSIITELDPETTEPFIFGHGLLKRGTLKLVQSENAACDRLFGQQQSGCNGLMNFRSASASRLEFCTSLCKAIRPTLAMTISGGQTSSSRFHYTYNTIVVPTAPDTEQLPIATEVDSNKCHVASDIGGLNDRPTGGQTTGCPLAILTMVHLKIWHPFSRPMKRWSRVLKIQS
ncbi:hypothetical protein T4B_15118 [Trichinella pseudospiralis]|uniref:Uncharacterized protein n=1 Tax=Trichinella pseudospiralis TaxID=6337 RepID=A0A0V1IW13_TRIPS|nr:hypothetical protein T4B_15118 [Trichinella pseudospiralis]